MKDVHQPYNLYLYLNITWIAIAIVFMVFLIISYIYLQRYLANRKIQQTIRRLQDIESDEVFALNIVQAIKHSMDEHGIQSNMLHGERLYKTLLKHYKYKATITLRDFLISTYKEQKMIQRHLVLKEIELLIKSNVSN